MIYFVINMYLFILCIIVIFIIKCLLNINVYDSDWLFFGYIVYIIIWNLVIKKKLYLWYIKGVDSFKSDNFIGFIVCCFGDLMGGVFE